MKELGDAGRQIAREARKRAGKARRTSRQAADNRWFEDAARVGYVVRALLYGAMGLASIGLAVSLVGDATDQRHTIQPLGGTLLGRAVLVVLLVPLGAYALWGFVRAVYDPLGKGDEPVGILTRLGYAWSGVAYTALLIFAVQLTAGVSSSDGGDSTQDLVRSVFRAPAGILLTGVAGAIGVAAGLAQFGEAVKAGFRKDLKRSEMNRNERVAADWLGRFGMVSRGVIFTMLGWFVLQAALQRDPNQAHGMSYAFQALAVQPLGHGLLFVIGLGFIALALHSAACARWIRMDV